MPADARATTDSLRAVRDAGSLDRVEACAVDLVGPRPFGTRPVLHPAHHRLDHDVLHDENDSDTGDGRSRAAENDEVHAAGVRVLLLCAVGGSEPVHGDEQPCRHRATMVPDEEPAAPFTKPIQEQASKSVSACIRDNKILDSSTGRIIVDANGTSNGRHSLAEMTESGYGKSRM